MTTRTNSRRKSNKKIRLTKKKWQSGEPSTMSQRVKRSLRDPSPRKTRRKMMTMMSMILSLRNLKATARRNHLLRSQRKKRKKRKTKRRTRKISKKRREKIKKSKRIKLRPKAKTNDFTYIPFPFNIIDYI